MDFFGFCVCNSFCSNNGAWYGRSWSTLKIGCRPRHAGMSSWKSFSPIYLRILYGPYCKGFIFLYGPVKHSFFRCNQTWPPIWNEWGIRCLSFRALAFAFAHYNISCACLWMLYIWSLKFNDVSNSHPSKSVSFDCVKELKQSIGIKGWNP